MAISEEEPEILSFINRNCQKRLRTTIKSVIEEFERKPFGW
ncbi:hypothetical protein [Bythopirellula polymerisocia]